MQKNRFHSIVRRLREIYFKNLTAIRNRERLECLKCASFGLTCSCDLINFVTGKLEIVEHSKRRKRWKVYTR